MPYHTIGLILSGWLCLMSTAAFLVTWGDKRRAARGAWRVPERTLFLLALLGGAAGTWFAMQIFRHKTRHRSFLVIIPMVMTVQVLAAVLLLLAPS